ncbi:DivIVA domain-containing protein [bacterium]|nr:DivIVA domain-containing protein [bacterium]
MRITPLDVRKQEFGKAMRGFDCDEVRGFLSTLADEYETVLVDNKQLRETIMAQDEKISGYQKIENALRDTMLTAQKAMADSKETARKEGDLIVKTAQQEARQIMEECRRRTEELRREIMMLRKEKEAYLARFRSLAEAQVKFVDTHETDFEDLDKRLVQMVDSVVGGLGSSSGEKTATPVFTAPADPVDAAPSAPPPPRPTYHSPEVDVWRDYKPATVGQEADLNAEEGLRDDAADEIVQSIASLEEEKDDLDPFTKAPATADLEVTAPV